MPLYTLQSRAQNVEEARIQDREARLDNYFDQLHDPGSEWQTAETGIMQIWSSSGSAAMDLLLRQGNAALDEGDPEAAIGHLTALTDHAPEFAEGWAARAMAFAAMDEIGPAIHDIARSLTLEPRHFGALTLLCELYEEMEAYDKAESACQASLALHPHQDAALDALARLGQYRDGTLL